MDFQHSGSTLCEIHHILRIEASLTFLNNFTAAPSDNVYEEETKLWNLRQEEITSIATPSRVIQTSDFDYKLLNQSEASPNLRIRASSTYTSQELPEVLGSTVPVLYRGRKEDIKGDGFNDQRGSFASVRKYVLPQSMSVCIRYKDSGSFN